MGKSNEFALKPGDSLRQSIDEGLRDARCAVVVISDAFIGKSWTEWELNGIIQNSFADSTRLLIPIWHNIKSEAVRQYSPSLANVVAIRSMDGIEVVADRICELVGPSRASSLTPIAATIDEVTRERFARILAVITEHIKSVVNRRDTQLFSVLSILADTPNGQVLETVGATIGKVTPSQISIRGSIAGFAIVNRETVTVADVNPMEERSQFKFWSAQEEMRSMIAIPIYSRVHLEPSVVGVLSITANQNGVFNLANHNMSSLIPLLQEVVSGALHS